LPLDPFDCAQGPDLCKSCFIIDPEGNRIEVMEQTKNAWQRIFEQDNPIRE